MKKKVIIAATALMLATTSAVSAAAFWGDYKGYDIVRVTIDGKTIKKEVPAISMEGRTMVPISMLKDAGVNYSWDQETKTVVIQSQKKNSPVTIPDKPISKPSVKSLTAKDIAKLSDRVGFVEVYDFNYKILGSGSGFMIEPGIFVTNSHVAYNAILKVYLDDTVYDTQSYYLFDNPKTDIFGVVLSTSYNETGASTGKIPSKMLRINATTPEVGDKVFIIASPKGFENSVSEGIVSGIRTIDGVQYIQHTASTESGSSGGVLLNEYGDVIGVHSWVRSDGDSLKFAIPIKYVQDEIDKLSNN